MPRLPSSPIVRVQMQLLRFGIDSSVQLTSKGQAKCAEAGIPQGEPIENLPAAIVTALGQPLYYPPLDEIITPGDRVVIALGPGMPQAAALTAAMVVELVRCGLDPDSIHVLRSDRDAIAQAESPLQKLTGKCAERVRLITHDPADRRTMAYLAATEAGEPILLNRYLTDADVVIPIGCLQRSRFTGFFGIHSCIFPEFSDAKTQARFRRMGGFAGSVHHRDALWEEVRHVAWLLGIAFTVQIVPGAGDRVLHVLAGASEAVRKQGQSLYRSAWKVADVERAQLVVAAIEGSPLQQTWENLGRTLAMAKRLVDFRGGSIAVCCDLALPPGPAVQRLIGSPSREEAVRKIRRDNARDCVAALQIARTLDSCHVYLLSRLDNELVEELEMIPISDPQEINRLMERNRSCLVLSNASRVIVKAAD